MLKYLYCNYRKMPGCCAENCTNSAAKGFQMCRVPRNDERRKKWIQNMNCTKTPGPNDMLCHVCILFIKIRYFFIF